MRSRCRCWNATRPGFTTALLTGRSTSPQSRRRPSLPVPTVTFPASEHHLRVFYVGVFQSQRTPAVRLDRLGVGGRWTANLPAVPHPTTRNVHVCISHVFQPFLIYVQAVNDEGEAPTSFLEKRVGHTGQDGTSTTGQTQNCPPSRIEVRPTALP